jgi:phosphatidylglycerol:prolipoprotein diacylglycerol transferase
MRFSPYTVVMLAGILLSGAWWWRRTTTRPHLRIIYLGGLLGAFLGAKIVYLTSEGWLHLGQPDMWLQFATGKSVLGALLGGYGGVELMKKHIGHREATGDWFAIIVPFSIALGRVGCVLHGCCLGQACEGWYTMQDHLGLARWPSAAVELLFNVLMIGVLWAIRRRGLLIGQHFHIYLMAYGIFRFVHEFVRATPGLIGPIKGYQLWSAVLFAFGLVRYLQRRTRSELPNEALPAVG